MSTKPTSPSASVKKESEVIDGKPQTKYLISLPEYENPIIVLEQHIPEVTKQLSLLMPKK